MYEAFYGLREKPFNLTPDPKFIYLGEKHKEAFAHLLYGIKNRSGFIMVTGEIGTGKTTICRTLLNQLDPNTEVAFIFNPYLSPDELLRKINEDFGIPSKADSVKGLIDELNSYLLDRNAKGKNCVLVIDEAQNLTPSVLEQIRLLSNLETESRKLMQIVLIGQPELMKHLSLDELRQLNQRITARYHLKPLDRVETYQYISHRLRVAGGRRSVHFTPAAVRQVFKHSLGTPRVINAVCDRALLIGYTRDTHDITPDIVKQAVHEIQGEMPKRVRSPWLRMLIPNSTIVIVIAALLVGGKYLVDRLPTPPSVGEEAPLEEGDTLWRSGMASPVVTATAEAQAIYSTAPPVPSTTGSAAEGSPITETITPVSVEPPLVDEYDPTFGGVLDRIKPRLGINAAVVGVLRAWNRAILQYPKEDTVEAIEQFAKDSRLACEILPLTLDQIDIINLPAVVRLHGNKQAIWCAIVGTEYDEYKVTTGMNETTLIPRDELAHYYKNEAIILWYDSAPEAPILKPGMSGEDIQVLQTQLRAVGRLDSAPTGSYDKSTANAVAKLQADTGIVADGTAGRQTRMVLYSWLPGFETPTLRQLPPPMLPMEAPEPLLASTKAAPAPAPETPPAPPASEPAPAPVPAPVEAAPAEPVSEPPATPEAAPVPPAPDTVTPAPAPTPDPAAGPAQEPAPEPAPVTVEDVPPPAAAPVAEQTSKDAPPAAPAPPPATVPTQDEAGRAVTPPSTSGLPLVPADPDAVEGSGP